MSIRSPQDCFTINSIFYSNNTRPLPERFSIRFLQVKKYRVGSPINADLPDRTRPRMPTEPDQYPTAWSGLIELI
ncbi:hypothetical protein DPMN_073743 [Dreissena polymorpha]|uniref:Uncharacterized protein n=1 Tax=Dreissena polymorpha TaxID=45954 RepID=A0A9D4HEG1_DREPO|nr:hypothetical protein DPMN_073743 [Dreissena polymorpha]